MENLKLLSVRLYPDTVAQIDNWAMHHRYWKRNTIICNVLKFVFSCTSDADICKLLAYYPRKGQKLKITVEIVSENENV